MSPKPRPLALAFTLLALAGLAAITAESAPPPVRKDFAERLAVRETEIVFGPADEIGKRDATPNAFRVSEDGERREVVRAERLPADSPWTFVVYFDRTLSSPETGFLATLALAQASGQLAETGSVELVVADPAPRIALAATREPRAIANGLADLAGELRVARDRSEHPDVAGAGRPPDPAAVRRQLDRLLAFVAGRPKGAPRALFLIADGADLPPAVLNALDRDRVDPAALPADGIARPYLAAAQVLAAYGWATFPLPFRSAGGGAPAFRSKDIPGGPTVVQGIDLFELFRRWRGKRPRRAPDSRKAEINSDAGLALLRAVARTTNGGVLGYGDGLATVLADLKWRWHLYFSAPAAPDGKLHAITIELGRTGEAIRAPQWVRSGVPEELADARLGALLAGGPAAGDLEVELRVEKDGGGETVRVRLAKPPPAEAGPLRVSLATDAGGTLRRDVLAGTEETVSLSPPALAHRLAAVVEDLGGDRWGSALADLR